MERASNGRKGPWIPLASLALLLLSTGQGWGDIYRYVDRNGVIHFTNTPTSSKYQLYIRDRGRVEKPEKDRERFDPVIQEASRRYGISFPLLKAMIQVESDYDLRAVSSKGAMGLMQIMPDTADLLDIRDPFDPRENIMGGTRYLKMMLERFNGELPLALAAYNAGPGSVDRYNRIPPYQETESYVKKILDHFNRFKASHPPR